MSTNFNDSIPAAPALGLNVAWQTDGSGNVSAYLPGGGIPTTPVDLTAQAADIVATTLYAVPTGFQGMYRVMAWIIVTQAATVSSTLPSVQIVFHDEDNNISQTLTLTPTNTGNAQTTFQSGESVIFVKDGANIQYQTSGYVTSGATPMNFALHLRIEPA